MLLLSLSRNRPSCLQFINHQRKFLCLNTETQTRMPTRASGTIRLCLQSWNKAYKNSAKTIEEFMVRPRGRRRSPPPPWIRQWSTWHYHISQHCWNLPTIHYFFCTIFKNFAWWWLMTLDSLRRRRWFPITVPPILSHARGGGLCPVLQQDDTLQCVRRLPKLKDAVHHVPLTLSCVCEWH